ncbi:hypothetical protein BH09PLA1_BH09PLA1_10830 [soil metagenome]
MNSASTGHTGFGGRKTSLATIGAGIGVAGNCVGWLIFLLMCFGFGAAVSLAILPFLAGLTGMILTVYGAAMHKHAGDVDTHVLASLFINLFAIVGGLSLMAVWRGWTVLH